jgi:hypothetical protein
LKAQLLEEGMTLGGGLNRDGQDTGGGWSAYVARRRLAAAILGAVLLISAFAFDVELAGAAPVHPYLEAASIDGSGSPSG